MSSVKTKNVVGKNRPQILAVITVSIAMFTTGLHTGWPAPSIPQLLSSAYPFDISRDAASYITIIGFVGTVSGGCANLLVDKLGRKKTIQLVAIPQVISLLLFVLSYEVMELIYVGRFIGGVAEGLSSNSMGLYVSEIASPKIRGLLGSILAISLYSGVLFINVIGSYTSIRTTALICLTFPIIFSLAFWKIPESPYYLLMKNREEDTAESLRFFRGKNDVSDELNSLKKDVSRQLSETGTLRDIFIVKSNRKAFLVTVGARFFQTMTGMASFNLYIQVLLSEATHSLSSHVGATIILLIQVVMTFVTTFIIDRLGRKPLLLISICGCFLNLFIQTVYFFLKDYTSIDVGFLDMVPLVLMIVHIILYSVGCGIVTSQIIAEMFSASVKVKLVIFVNGLYAIFTMVSTKFFQATSDEFGLAVPFGSFGLLTFFGIFFIWFCVPETKAKTLEQIQQQLKGARKEKDGQV